MQRSTGPRSPPSPWLREVRIAIDLFVSRITRELGGLAATLGGLDALVFTGGIGEHGANVRRRVCPEAAWLGVELDQTANLGNHACITASASRTSAWVIPTNEELILVGHAQALLQKRDMTRCAEPSQVASWRGAPDGDGGVSRPRWRKTSNTLRVAKT